MADRRRMLSVSSHGSTAAAPFFVYQLNLALEARRTNRAEMVAQRYLSVLLAQEAERTRIYGQRVRRYCLIAAKLPDMAAR